MAAMGVRSILKSKLLNVFTSTFSTRGIISSTCACQCRPQVVGLPTNDGTAQITGICVRSYAKVAKKEKGKTPKKGSSLKMDIFKTLSLDTLNELVEYDLMCAKMQKCVEHLQEQLADKITVRSSPGAFDNIMVNTPDGRFRLQELAQIIQKNPQLIAIDLEAAPQYAKDVKTALMSSGLNVNPQQDGTTFFVNIPKVTREHREGLAKNAHGLGSKSKEALRNIVSKYSKDLKSNCREKDKLNHAQEAIMNTSKKFTLDIDALVEKKTTELLQ